MAFGDVKGTLSGIAASVTNPMPATGSVAVSVGDLIFVTIAQQTTLANTACADNLGNTYTAVNAGTANGSSTKVAGRSYYSVVTASGTLTTVNVTTTASTNDAAVGAVVYTGPFIGIDKSPANGATDISSPISCPATGTLSQAIELVIGWVASGGGTLATWTGSGVTKNLEVNEPASGTSTAKVVIGAVVTSATTTVTPAFTTGTAPSVTVPGTVTFKNGNLFSVSVSESGTLADTPSGPAAFASAMAESGALVDTDTTAMTSASGVAFGPVSLANSSNGWSGRTLRQILGHQMLNSVSGSSLSVRLVAAPGTSGTFGPLYVGHAALTGDPYDIDATTMVQLTYDSGSSTKAVTATTSPVNVDTDTVSFPGYDVSRNLIVACDFSGATVNLEIGNTDSAVTPVPGMIQHTASTSNVSGRPNLGSGPFNTFKFTLPHAVGAGNCLVLGLLYQHGQTPTVTDNNGNTWPGSPTVSADGGTSKFVSAIFVLPNANAGLTQVTVAFGTGSLPFQYTLTEFSNIATSSPGGGSQGTANVTGSSLACGSFTPTNNDATGGNLIYSFFGPSAYSTIAQNPSAWTPGSGAAILDCDTAWTNTSGVPHASQWQVQGTSASINPGMTATGVTTDAYNCVSVALKIASAGTARPAGIHIDRLLHQGTTQATTGGAAPNPLVLQFPTTGNLRVINITSAAAGSTDAGLTVTDSDGNTWTAVEATTNNAFFYQANCSANPNLTVTIVGLDGGGAGFQWYNSYRLYDISGAATSPYAGSGTGTSSGSSPFNSEPNITPTAAPGVTLAWIGLNVAAPPFTVAPSGSIIDVCQYTNQTDGDTMDNSDGVAHLFHTTTSAQSWNWTESGGSSPVWSVAVAFKAA